jgi:polyhydroxyalkanoate synthesis regulator phasin
LRRISYEIERQVDWREDVKEGSIEMKELTHGELRAKRVRSYMADLLEAARSAHEATAVLHHTSYSITEFDSLKLHTNFIRAQAERISSIVNELVGKIEAGEITMEDFPLK